MTNPSAEDVIAEAGKWLDYISKFGLPEAPVNTNTLVRNYAALVEIVTRQPQEVELLRAIRADASAYQWHTAIDTLADGGSLNGPSRLVAQACHLGCGYQFYEGFERCPHQRTREQSYHRLSPAAIVGIQNDARLKAVWARQVALAGTPFQEGGDPLPTDQQEPPKEPEGPILAFQAWCERYTKDRGPLTQDQYFLAQQAFYAAHPGQGPTSTLMAAEGHQQEPPQEPANDFHARCDALMARVGEYPPENWCNDVARLAVDLLTEVDRLRADARQQAPEQAPK